MQELIWIIEPVRVWLEGGTAEEIFSTQGFLTLAALGTLLVPSTVIALGVGVTEWRETPLAAYFGVSPDDPDQGWGARAQLRAMGESKEPDEA